MKIEFQLTNYKLSFLNEMIADNLSGNAHFSTKEAKSFNCLMNEIAEKLLKKAISKRSISKPFKISLKYYEAYTLYQFLLTFIDYEETEKRRITREIIGIINKELT